MSMPSLSQKELASTRSPISEAWASSGLCSQDILPHNEFNVPGLRVKDVLNDRIIFDALAYPTGDATVVAQFRKE